MSKFLTPLDVEEVNDLAASGRGFWRITSPLAYQSDILKKTITVEAWFLTDYASVPRIPFAYWLLGDTSHPSSVVHDWLYHHHEICSEAEANKVLLEAMLSEGVPRWRAYGIYAGVAIGGKSSWDADGKGNGHSIVNGEII